MDQHQVPGGDQAPGWLQDDPQPAPAEYRKLMLSNLPEYRGPPKQSWSAHIRRLEMSWAAYRVPPHDSLNRRNALLLSLVGQAAEMASHLFGEAGQALTYEQVKTECELLFRPAFESQTLKQAFRDYKQHSTEPIQAYISTKCALYRDAYNHEDLELLVDELNRGIRNANVKRLMMNHEIASVPEYTRKAMFTVTMVTKQLKEGVCLVDSTDGLTGSACIQLPQYDESEPMEIGSLAPGLHQMGKVAPDDKVPGRCYRCQGRGHRARDCPTPMEVSLEERRTQPRRDRSAKCERCHYDGHTAAECRADWAQVASRRRTADKGAPPGKPSRVAHMEGSAPPAPPPQAAAPRAADRADGMPQFGTVPARINVLGGAAEPNRVGLGFSLNHLGPELIQPNNIAEPEVLRPQPFSLNMMEPARPSLPSKSGGALPSVPETVYGRPWQPLNERGRRC